MEWGTEHGRVLPVEVRRAGRARGALAVGLLLAAAAVVVMSAGSPEQAWVTQEPVEAGQPLHPELFVLTDVDVPDSVPLWPADEPPSGSAAGDLPAGALLLSAGDTGAGPAVPEVPDRTVTLPVAAAAVPSGLEAGDRVGVWIVSAGRPREVLPDVPVVAVSAGDEFAGGPLGISVGVEPEQTGAAVTASAADDVHLVRIGR